MSQSIRQNIDQFLSQKRFAMIGVSRDPKHFSRSLYNEFLKNGYEVVPVNLNAEKIDGQQSYSHVADIVPSVSQALIMTPHERSEQAVRECHAAGVKTLWLYGVAGMKGQNDPVLKFCTENNIDVVPGYCPFMFMPESSVFHHFHGFLFKMVGKYPK